MLSADNSIKNDQDSTWFDAYPVGIITKCGMIGSIKYQLKAKTEDESVSAHMLEEVANEYQRYCSEGAASKKKVA